MDDVLVALRVGLDVVGVNSCGRGPVVLVPKGLGGCFWKFAICMDWAETSFSAVGDLVSISVGAWFRKMAMAQ